MDDLSREYRIENTAERCVYMQCRGINGQHVVWKTKGHNSTQACHAPASFQELGPFDIITSPEVLRWCRRLLTSSTEWRLRMMALLTVKHRDLSHRHLRPAKDSPDYEGKPDKVCFLIFQKIPQTEGKLAPHSDSLIVALLTTADKDKRRGSVQLADICWWWL